MSAKYRKCLGPGPGGKGCGEFWSESAGTRICDACKRLKSRRGKQGTPTGNGRIIRNMGGIK